MDKVLVKHVSKLEKEKMRINSGEEWGPVKRSHRNIHSETNEARERELQEAWGGQGLGNSIKPRLSKLEREKVSLNIACLNYLLELQKPLPRLDILTFYSSIAF